jgi:hypothetical protein
LLLAMIALTVTPVGSLAQEPTEAPSNPFTDEAQNATKAPPLQPPAPAAPTPAAPQKGVQSPFSRTPEAAEPLPKRGPCALE